MHVWPLLWTSEQTCSKGARGLNSGRLSRLTLDFFWLLRTHFAFKNIPWNVTTMFYGEFMKRSGFSLLIFLEAIWLKWHLSETHGSATWWGLDQVLHFNSGIIRYKLTQRSFMLYFYFLFFWNLVYNKEQEIQDTLALSILWLYIYYVAVWDYRTEEIFLNGRMLIFMLLELEIIKDSLSRVNYI